MSGSAWRSMGTSRNLRGRQSQPVTLYNAEPAQLDGFSALQNSK